jgi:hypothetical protein
MDAYEEIKRMLEERIRDLTGTGTAVDSVDVAMACAHLTGEERRICEETLRIIAGAKSMEDLIRMGIIV